MRLVQLLLSALLASPLVLAAHAEPAGCTGGGNTLGVTRIVEIDTSTGALFGAISKQTKEPRFLEPYEVVLTFDDGPMPPVTRAILDSLDRFCTKATFFEIGQMAIAYPATVKSIIARGHTVGSHTWSHPLNLRHLPLEKAITEIEKGYAAVTLAAGQPVAPFFRFPGLSDSAAMLAHLQERGIASFTVDAVSDDSYISDSERLLEHALKEIETQKGGIVLFHDIKPATARMLPQFLSQLQARGYHIVHMRPKGQVTPMAGYTQTLAPLLAKSEKTAAAGGLVPFYGLLKPGISANGEPENATPAVTEIRPSVRPRTSKDSDSIAKHAAVSNAPHTQVRGWSERVEPGPDGR